MMEFHISRRARDRYQFDDSLFSLSGRVVLANFHAARVLAQKMNEKRDLVNFPETAVAAADINAMGLIDEVLHYMIAEYRKQVNPRLFADALNKMETDLGPQTVNRILTRFVDEFPPNGVYRQQVPAAEYLADSTNGVPNREIVLEEMLLNWAANLNPAYAPYRELFDDSPLQQERGYTRMFGDMRSFFDLQRVNSADNLSIPDLARVNLLDLLRGPALASPYSLYGQLEFLSQKWGAVIGPQVYRVLTSLDLYKEDAKRFVFGFAPGGPGPVEVADYAELEAEPEAFSMDLHWMPRVVMIAKNTYVWLDQLSRQYGRSITRLNDIPDEELDKLAHRGFTGLWLIGLWERSNASREIKQMMGNADAVASAYSLFDYRIADDLGGTPAYESLRDRAWQRGVRLASDMVPNHMGIDSPWVMQHADWFIGRPDSPYPVYTFNGPDLSWDPNVGVYLEDHYFTRTDASVVFKRVDRNTGSEVYVYHGNDGTSMPWNDTAQLDYLNPDVREAVIQTILQVARQFPIIRFDAAMTLAKRHYQRLWFPEPGTGGAIPSRSEFAMTKAEFDAAMPIEFWREVVDRVAVEAPDTLLLAEAFWLMEGYFVRTLGMHRVYNSAFMNLLRDEENAKYRTVMKNTMEFDPEVLKRFVNFMNNPDEKTAVEQFGKGDKYFGIATVMSTMPGLPMFGHGQVEGYAEKYGMEFRRPLWDESDDPYLIARHEREIFPLLHKRYLFADVENFLLYDFITADGSVDENVYAYSNSYGDEKGLVVYHNKFADTRGWINVAVPYPVKTGEGDERAIVTKTLAEGLGLTDAADRFVIFRDHSGSLEYIRRNQDLIGKGLYLELGGYRYHTFLDFREVQDDATGQYSRLEAQLGGRGVPSIDEALRELTLEPVRAPYAALVNTETLRRIRDICILPQAAEGEAAAPTPAADGEDAVPTPVADGEAAADEKALVLRDVGDRVEEMLQAIQGFSGADVDAEVVAETIRRHLDAVVALPSLRQSVDGEAPAEFAAALDYLFARFEANPALWGGALAWVFTRFLGDMMGEPDAGGQTRTLIDAWRLGRVIAPALEGLGMTDATAWRAVATIKLFSEHDKWFGTAGAPGLRAYRVLESWLRDSEVQQYLGVNRYQGVLWFNHEAFEQLLWAALLHATIGLLANETEPSAAASSQVVQGIAERYAIIERLQEAEKDSKYQIARLMSRARGENGAAPTKKPEPVAPTTTPTSAVEGSSDKPA
ncbi:MAG: alpha-amylase family glycosyl hydrolase [Anaerolineae bacterium]